MRTLLLVLCAVLAATAPAGAQQQSSGFDFSIANIMRGPEIVGREPDDVRWTPDSRWIYFRWNEPGTDWREPLRLYRVRPSAGATPERVPDAQRDSVGALVADGDYSTDRRRKVVEYEGDIYLVDARRGTVRRLTQTLEDEREPSFGRDGRVFFLRDDNIFSLDPASGFVRQLTNVRSGAEPKDSSRTGQRSALEADQRMLFEAIRDRIQRDSIRKAEREEREALAPKPFYLRKQERIENFAISPDGASLVLTTRTDAAAARRTEVPEYVTASGYTENIDTRTKVGDVPSSGRVVFMHLPSGDSRPLAVVPGDSAARPSFVELLGWNEDGSHALLFTVARNYKTRWLQTVGADSGTVRTIDTLADSTWVSGPCFGCAGWYDEGRRAWFVSEADGYAHVYTAAADGSDRRQLTKDPWEVLDASLSPDAGTLYLHTSEGSPYERHYEELRLSTGRRTRLTSRAGGHDVEPSPDGKLLADVYSYANHPPELFVMPRRSGAEMAQLTTSPTPEWLSFRWIVPEIVTIPASDGVHVPARIYRPADVGAQPNGAGVIFVHGAGYLHNVHNYWSSYFREYMFNQYLASQGYTVLDIDYRGSAGYGRDWRTAIYRHMGGRDLQDQVDGARYLQQNFGIDPERIGLYGGSYGGFITLMALFTEPEWFGAGAALRSVTDWAHYNHGYTARILNQPQDDTLAFRRSSPIYFAEGLEDPLLMAHGMVDVNVHFQDIVRLSQRLIELGKTDWELAVYPVEGHAFVRPSSWADEYRRIFELFERNLRPAGAARAAGGAR